MADGLKRLQKRLRVLREQAREASSAGAVVGYAAAHALIIHEDLSIQHKPGKQAKYLEATIRTKSKETLELVTQRYKETGNLNKALLAGALFVKHESQKIVPVDTGALHASGYACLAKNDERTAAEAASRAEKILGVSSK